MKGGCVEALNKICSFIHVWEFVYTAVKRPARDRLLNPRGIVFFPFLLKKKKTKTKRSKRMKRDIFQRQIFLPYWFPPIFSPNLHSQPYPPPPTKPPAPLQPTAAPLLALSLSLTRTQQLKDSPPTSTVPRISDEGAPTTHRSTAQRRSKTKPTTVFSLYGISLSLSMVCHCRFFMCFFFSFSTAIHRFLLL
jgi:hypothetical protein